MIKTSWKPILIKGSIKAYLLDLIFLVLVFQQSLLMITGGTLHMVILYLDEALECFLLVAMIGLSIVKRPSLLRIEKFMIAAMLVFLLCGLISNWLHLFQPTFLVISDALICVKFLVFYLGVRILLTNQRLCRQVLVQMNSLCKIISVVFFLLTLHDLLLPRWFPEGQFRYFAYSTSLIFPHPTYLAVASFTIAAVMMANMEISEKAKKTNMKYIMMMCFIVLMTLRVKAIVSIFCCLLFYMYLIVLRIRSTALLGISGSILAAFFGWDQVNFYYNLSNITIVRVRLVVDSIKLASEYFPFGTGFASFGSNIAATYYSPLYTMLGYPLLDGGSPTNNQFLSDTFWPIVIAQTGWIGALGFVCVVVAFGVLVMRMKKNIYYYWTLLSILCYVIISSTSESAFFNPSIPCLFVLFALIINLSKANIEDRFQRYAININMKV